MFKIFRNKVFTWSVVALFVLLSPVILEMRFKNEIKEYHENKKIFISILNNVQDFKDKYYPERIPKTESVNFTQVFSENWNFENINLISAKVEKGIFKVVIEIPGSHSSCIFRQEIATSHALVQTLTPFAQCKTEASKYQFSAI